MVYFEVEFLRCFCAARKGQICMSCEASINELHRMMQGALPIPPGMKHWPKDMLGRAWDLKSNPSPFFYPKKCFDNSHGYTDHCPTVLSSSSAFSCL